MIRYFLLSAAAILPAVPALAQTENTAPCPRDASVVCDDADLSNPDIVVTAARAAQPIDQVGQAITVIDRPEIDRRQSVVVSDLLATTPGVTVTRNGSVGGFTGVRIRGAEAEQTLVVIDGVRVNDPSSPGGGFDFANLLSSSVERIEVLRGPNSVPWGSQAIGGVVNIVTQAPTEGVQARVQAEYGYADHVFASGGVSGATGGLSGALTAGYLRSDGISSAADGIERDGYRQFGASGRIGVEFAPGIGLDFRGYYAHSRARIDGFPPPDYVLADDPEYQKTQELYGYAGAHANLANGRFDNRIAFTIADINRDSFDPTYGSDPSFIGRGRSERYEYQGDFRPVDRVRIVAGAEREDSHYYDGADRFSTGIWSGYGQLIVQPVRALTLTGGVRYDDHDQFGSKTTFGADAALALHEGTTLRASYGEGFKAPTLYQLYSDYGNRGLDPETARNFDAGVEQALLEGRATIAATYFNRITKDQIDFRSCTRAEQTTPGSICVGRPFGVYDNLRRTTADGVEFTLAVKPTTALTMTANYSYIDSENRTPGANFGKDLARRPHQTVNLNVDYRLRFGLALGSTVSVVGDSFDDSANRTRLDGYVLTGLRAELPIGDRFALYGRVDNVFGVRYQTVAGYGTYGRAAYGGVRLRFD